MQLSETLPTHVSEYSEGSPANRVVQSQIGDWPGLEHLIGCEVIKVRLLRHRGSLILELARRASLAPPVRLEIPPYWIFTSCMMTFSSLEIFSGMENGADDEMIEIPELIGLEGARLTDLESDHEHFDLVFNSIRISVIPEAF